MSFSESISQKWGSSTNANRIGLLVGLIAIILLFIALMYWIFSDTYTLLFGDLEPRDASKIISELDSLKIDYELANDGRKILVDEDEVYETRLKLMGEGVLLGGGVGFEIFDDENFGTTEFVQKINYQRALQGELVRTIMSINNIKFARVHLVLPETSVFKQKKTLTSASVTVVMHKGRRLSAEQVTGIRRLVSSSVSQLSLDRVTVLNQDGVTLASEVVDEYNLQSVSYRLRKKRDVEEYLVQKAQKILDKSFGIHQATVMIDVNMNMNNSKVTRENVITSGDGSQNILKKRETRSTKRLGTDGKGTNVSTEIEYQLGKEIEQVVFTPGEIKKLTVAVVVPNIISDAEKDMIKDVVASAVGLDVQRGDVISIYLALHLAELSMKEAAVFPEFRDDTSVSAGVTDSEYEKENQDIRIMPTGGHDGNENGVADRLILVWTGLALAKPLLTIFLLGAVVLFVFIILVYSILLRRNISQAVSANPVKNMSENKREEILNELREWLGVEEADSKVQP